MVVSNVKVDLKLGDVKEHPPRFIRKRISESASEANFYPRNYDKLVREIADYNGLESENILLVDGTDGAIDLIAKTFAKKVIYFTPTYYEFRAAAERNRIPRKEIKTVPIDRWRARALVDHCPGDFVVYNTPQEEFYCGSISLEDRDDPRNVIFLCNPNNPFGEISVPCSWPLLKESKGIIAVDETYHGFGNFGTLIDRIEEFPNLLVMRSFSKEHGLAGLRIGYIAGQPEKIKQLADSKVFFDVSSVSVECASAALEGNDYFEKRTKRKVRQRRGFEYFLEKLGLPVVPTYTNNILLHFNLEPEADTLVNYLKDNGVLVNQGDGISTVGLDKSWVRMCCGTKDQMKRVREVISSYAAR